MGAYFEHAIHLVGSENDETATLTTEQRDGGCHITLRYRDRVIETSATDYFEAFSQIRLQLEPECLIPRCYGASLNVFPSGMARDMGSGLFAYRLTMGAHATKADLVRIFDSGPDIIPASVADQKAYFNDWLKGPKR